MAEEKVPGQLTTSGNVAGPLYPRLISVLLVFESPADLDRICHQIEKNGDLMVDFSVSADDAIHLMHYVPFDVIVTEYDGTPGDRIGFLKRLRSGSIPVPVIYYARIPGILGEEGADQYGPVYFVRRYTDGPAPEPDELYLAIIRAVSDNR